MWASPSAQAGLIACVLPCGALGWVHSTPGTGLIQPGMDALYPLLPSFWLAPSPKRQLQNELPRLLVFFCFLDDVEDEHTHMHTCIMCKHAYDLQTPPHQAGFIFFN